MAKYKTSGLITEIRGSIGDKTFYYWKGVPVVRKKKGKQKQGNSLAQVKIRETFTFLTKTWAYMSFENWALWEEYAKKDRRIKNNSKTGLMNSIGNWMSGKIAYMSVNGLLIACGFAPLEKPIFGKPKPPLPSTDLPPLSKWTKDIKFNIWLPEDYPDRCVVQIWAKKITSWKGDPNIITIAPLSTSPTEVKIEKIKFRKNGKIVEKNLNEIGYTKLLLQMRVIAENGRFSIPSSIYKIEFNSSTLKPLNSSTFHPIAKNRFRFPTNK
ncbi:hypothetical protein KAW50_06860 [candidate division WOR-3 bacterium]|nr:hypothetical protein [candidate division WOR-3 bacterium]